MSKLLSNGDPQVSYILPQSPSKQYARSFQTSLPLLWWPKDQVSLIFQKRVVFGASLMTWECLPTSPQCAFQRIPESRQPALHPSILEKKFLIPPAPWLPGLLVAGWLHKCPGTKLAFLATLPAHTSCPSTDAALPLISLSTAKARLLKKILLKAGAWHHYNSEKHFHAY